MVHGITKVIVLVLVVLQLFVELAEPQIIAQCGVPQISKTFFILRDFETFPGEWPWHAAVYHRRRRENTYACGGTLVSDRFILTAAHCVMAENGHQVSNWNIFVRLGVHNLRAVDPSTLQQHSVRKIHLHPSFSNDDVRNDIAILELESIAKFNKYVQPACLSLTRDLTGRIGMVIGWEMTENEEAPGVLRSSRMPVVDTITCLNSDREIFGKTLRRTIFCAGYDNGTTVCNGNSGSGLFFIENSSWYLGGIVSFTGSRSLNDGRCSRTGYGTFTNVHMYLGWISSIVRQQTEDEIYHCNKTSTSCDDCLALDKRHQCGWCSLSNTCEMEHQCGISGDIDYLERNDWLDSQQTCPKPEIHSFDPKMGPWEGGTNITIRGINLGKKFEDVYGGVKIAGIDCIPIRELYVQANKIVCNMNRSEVKSHRSGRVVVQVSSLRAESTSDFVFVDPEITDFTPKFGPIAGGTIIKIVGKNLNTGSRVKTFLDQHPCEILSTDENETTCRTTAVQSMIFGKLHMEFDNGVREFNGDNFEYVSNPSIDYVTSEDPGQNKTIRSIPAGGIKIYVVGQNFYSIEKPKVYVYYRDQIYQNECNSTSNKEILCLSPKIDLHEAEILRSDEPLQLEYGFIMDDVQSVKNLSSKLGSWFELYPNPVFYPFEENAELFKGEYLYISGRNLNQVCKKSDVTVKIGDNATCNITSLHRNQLICRYPMDQEIKQANIKVIVGHGLTYDIGQISIWPSNSNDYTVWMAMIGFTILVLIFVGFPIVCCKKTTANK